MSELRVRGDQADQAKEGRVGGAQVGWSWTEPRAWLKRARTPGGMPGAQPDLGGCDEGLGSPVRLGTQS